MNKSELRKHYQQPKTLVKEAFSHKLEATSRRFIEATTLLVVSSINDAAYPDISPRGGAAGFIKILDANHIAFLDAPGNNKILTFGNLASRPEVGLLFIVPGVKVVLRAYGLAHVTADDVLIRSLGGSERTHSKAVVQIEITKIFPHCGKALQAAQLWEHEKWPTPDEHPVPSLMEMAKSMAACRNTD